MKRHASGGGGRMKLWVGPRLQESGLMTVVTGPQDLEQVGSSFCAALSSNVKPRELEQIISTDHSGSKIMSSIILQFCLITNFTDICHVETAYTDIKIKCPFSKIIKSPTGYW